MLGTKGLAGDRGWKVSLSALMLWTAACAGSSQFDNAHQEALRDSVAHFLDVYQERSATGARDSLLEMYSEGTLRWVEDGQVRYRSVQDIADALGALPPEARIESVYSDVEILPLAPGTAWVVMGFQSKFVDPTGPTFAFGGTITMVLSHQAAGWQIVAGHASSPRSRGGG